MESSSKPDKHWKKNNVVLTAENMRIMFTNLSDCVMLRLEERKISVEKILEVLDQNDLEHASQECKSAEDVADLFVQLRCKQYLSFLNPSVLGVIIDELAGAFKGDFEDYEKASLRPYCRQSISELSADKFCDQNCNNNRKKLVLKVDRNWDMLRLEDVMKVKRKLAYLLGIAEGLLVIECVKEGCVRIDFLVSPGVAEHILSLKFGEKHNRAFKHLRVLDLACDSVQIYRNVAAYQQHAKTQIRKQMSSAKQTKPSSNGIGIFVMIILVGQISGSACYQLRLSRTEGARAFTLRCYDSSPLHDGKEMFFRSSWTLNNVGIEGSEYSEQLPGKHDIQPGEFWLPVFEWPSIYSQDSGKPGRDKNCCGDTYPWVRVYHQVTGDFRAILPKITARYLLPPSEVFINILLVHTAGDNDLYIVLGKDYRGWSNKNIWTEYTLSSKLNTRQPWGYRGANSEDSLGLSTLRPTYSQEQWYDIAIHSMCINQLVAISMLSLLLEIIRSLTSATRLVWIVKSNLKTVIRHILQCFYCPIYKWFKVRLWCNPICLFEMLCPARKLIQFSTSAFVICLHPPLLLLSQLTPNMLLAHLHLPVLLIELTLKISTMLRCISSRFKTSDDGTRNLCAHALLVLVTM